MPAKKGSSRSTTTPTLSVITVCRNSARTIGRTIESVRSQSVPVGEYIIIDGASTDDTLDVVRSFGRTVTTLVSEPDNGISDAFNKGLARARGKFIKILNADDWMAEDTLEKSLMTFGREPDAGFVFGDLVEVDPETGKKKRVAGDPDYRRWITRTMGLLNHPATLVRREVYDRWGGFGVNWRIAMDYDWFLRVHTRGVRGAYSSDIVVYMQTGGMATASRIGAFREVRDISIEHGYPRTLAYGYYGLRLAKHAAMTIAGMR